jgi:hypothetical protein
VTRPAGGRSGPREVTFELWGPWNREPQSVSTTVCPAAVTLTAPPHMHWQVDESFNAASPATVTLEAPGLQGDVVIGMHGWGVSTPKAAAVAAATCGLLGDMHIPKGIRFTMGVKSWTVAAAMLEGPLTMFVGRTESCDGALPIVHDSDAPWTTSFGMSGQP